MIAYLSGVIASKSVDSVVVDVNGVGYGVRVSVSDQAKLMSTEKAQLFIYEHIREDAHDLYGFVEETTKQLFEQLLSVKNVGPRVALSVVDLGSEGSVRSAIASGDVKLLQSAKGVGKRAAEQIVVELRDKLGLVSSSEAEDIVYRGGVGADDEAVQGLMALGYSDADAQRALASIDKALPAEDRIKQALKGKF